MVIGYTNPGYPVRRTILGVCPEVSYRRVRAIGSLLSRPLGHLSRAFGHDLVNSYLGGF